MKIEEIKVNELWFEQRDSDKQSYLWRMRFFNLSSMKTEKISITQKSKSGHARNEARRILLVKAKNKIDEVESKFSLFLDLEYLKFSKVVKTWLEDSKLYLKASSYEKSRKICKKRVEDL